MALTGVIFLVGIVIVINDLVGNPALTDLSETPFSVLSRRLRTIPFHKLKIPLVVFQVKHAVVLRVCVCFYFSRRLPLECDKIRDLYRKDFPME